MNIASDTENVFTTWDGFEVNTAMTLDDQFCTFHC